MVTINTPPSYPSLFELSVAVSPSTPITFTTTSVTLTGASANANVALTFTATAVLVNSGNDLAGVPSLVEYRWDFGDGSVAYGNPAIHTYRFIQPVLPVILRITDSFGRVWATRKNVYLD